jgi:outer membrane protein OmpA-like peptidoglycan-associated protein
VDLEVFFAYNSHAIGNEALTVLRTLGRALSDARLSDDAFLIAGHTDAKGGAAFNLELSQRRAEAVRQFLIANFGIDAGKLTAKGFGSTHLKDPAHPRAADNRRVQIVNLSKEEARSGIAR